MAKKTVTGRGKSYKGTKSADLITVKGNENYVLARAGNDTITVISGVNHWIEGEAGNDKITIKGGNSSNILGNKGNDVIIVKGGSNLSIDGDDDDTTGNDTITLLKGTKNDITVKGNGGSDTIIVKSAGKGLLIFGGYECAYEHLDYDDGDTIILEKGVKSGAGVYGENGNDTITINGSSDHKISGGNGKDKITVSGGSKHTIYGEKGNDKITVSSGSNHYIDGGKGNDTINITKGTDHLILTGNGKDTITISGGKDHGVLLQSGTNIVNISNPQNLDLEQDSKYSADTITVNGNFKSGHLYIRTIGNASKKYADSMIINDISSKKVDFYYDSSNDSMGIGFADTRFITKSIIIFDWNENKAFSEVTFSDKTLSFGKINKIAKTF